MTPRALQYADGVEWDSDFVLDCHIRHPDALAHVGLPQLRLPPAHE